MPWGRLFQLCEEKREKIIDEASTKSIFQELKIREEDVITVQDSLYHALRQCLKGRTQVRPTTAGASQVLEKWRALYYEGMSFTQLALFNGKRAIWRAA